MFIEIADDLDLEKIVRSGQCFRAVQLENGFFRFMTGTHVLHIRQIQPGTFETDASADEWRGTWTRYFDLERNYREVRRRIPDGDAFLRACADHGAGIRILKQDPWETIVSFIISQRKSIPAIRAAIETVSTRLGTPIQTASGIVYAFPTAEQLSAASCEELRSCALGYRVPYVADAARKAVSGEIDPDLMRDMNTEELTQALLSIKGVGKKVANCVLLFAYGRTACSPVDTWIQKVIHSCYGGRDPFPAFGEDAGIYQQYMFYYAISHRDIFSNAADQIGCACQRPKFML